MSKLPKALICPLPNQLQAGNHGACPYGVGCLEEWAAAAFDGSPTWGGVSKDNLSPTARRFVKEVLAEVGMPNTNGARRSDYTVFDITVNRIAAWQCGVHISTLAYCHAWRMVAERWGYDTRNQPRLPNA